MLSVAPANEERFTPRSLEMPSGERLFCTALSVTLPALGGVGNKSNATNRTFLLSTMDSVFCPIERPIETFY